MKDDGEICNLCDSSIKQFTAASFHCDGAGCGRQIGVGGVFFPLGWRIRPEAVLPGEAGFINLNGDAVVDNVPNAVTLLRTVGAALYFVCIG